MFFINEKLLNLFEYFHFCQFSFVYCHSSTRFKLYVFSEILRSGTNFTCCVFYPGHFTQVVWKGSREIGIGRAQSRDGKWFVVANFFPAGNMIGRNAENVFPTRDGKIVMPPKNTDDTAKPGLYYNLIFY